MVRGEETILDQLADGVNKAEGVVGAIDIIVNFEDILNSRQKKADEIISKHERNDDVPENLVAGIKEEMGERSESDTKLRGQMAAVERTLKDRMAEGRNPAHAVIKDNGVEITYRDDDGR